jgi:hypothetical protein
MTMRDELQKHSVPDGMMARLTLQLGAGSSARNGLVSGFCTSTGGGTGLLLVPSYHKSLTPPQGVVVQPGGGENQFPRPRRF